MRSSRSFFGPAAAALLLCVAACEPGSDLQPIAASGTASAYTLSTGDQVRITTFGEQGLSGQFVVDDSGNIAVPLVGPIPATGLTTRGLADAIRDDLRAKKLLGNPSVVVEIATYRPVFVLGEVQHPGEYPFRPHMTMLSAVALAGGFTPRAVTARASVVRSASGGSTEGRIARDSQIEPGDVVTIFERTF